MATVTGSTERLWKSDNTPHYEKIVMYKEGIALKCLIHIQHRGYLTIEYLNPSLDWRHLIGQTVEECRCWELREFSDEEIIKACEIDADKFFKRAVDLINTVRGTSQ